MPTGNTVNSAGSLVGSVLESAGYIYQSSILDTLGGPLKDEIGALVYLVGISIVVVQIAVLKSSKLAPWLLVGPAIFLFVIGERDSISNAKWQFGTNPRFQADVDKGVNDVTGGQGNARVSKVFKRYVEVVSTSFNEIVDIISGTQIENDLSLVTKGQLYGMMTTIQGENVGLKQMIQYGLMGQCYLAIQAARAVDDPLRRIVQPKAIKSEIDGALRFNAPTREEAERFYNEVVNKRTISFQGNDDILRFIASSEGATGEALTARVSELSGLAFSCSEVWNFVSLAILKEASKFEKGLEREAENLGMDPAAAKNMLLNASGIDGGPLESTLEGGTNSDNAQLLAKVIAKFYLRNESRNPDVGSRLAGLVGRNDFRNISAKLGGSNAFTEQARVGASEWAEKERLMYSAQALPVYQGLALYFLAIAFPFFALLLLIPGKSTGFLLWFLLWLWIKSWDVALAIVMQIDTIFWSLYSVQKQQFLGPNADVLPTDFGAAFAALELMDPTFQMTGYYTILAVCILAVPVVTAQFILGGMKGGASIIAQGINKYSDFYADAMLTRTEQGVINQLKTDQIAMKEERGAALAFGGAIARETMQGRDAAVNVNAPPGTKQYFSDRAGPTFTAFGNNPAAAVSYNRIGQIENNAGPRLANANSLIERSARNEAMVNPNRPFLTTEKKTVSDILLDVKTKERGFQGTVGSQEYQIAKADLNAQITHVGFVTDTERKAYEIHERIAVMRGIPVPWLEFGEEGSAREVDRHKAAFGARIELLKSMVGTASSTVENWQDLAKGYGAIPAAAAIGTVQTAETLIQAFDPVMMQTIIDQNGLEVRGNAAATRSNVIKFYSENYTEQEMLQLGSTLETIKNSGIDWQTALNAGEATEVVGQYTNIQLAQNAVKSFDPVLLQNAIDFNGVRVEGDQEASVQNLVELYAQSYSAEDIIRMTSDLSTVKSGQTREAVRYTDTRDIDHEYLDEKHNKYRTQKSSRYAARRSIE